MSNYRKFFLISVLFPGLAISISSCLKSKSISDSEKNSVLTSQYIDTLVSTIKSQLKEASLTVGNNNKNHTYWPYEIKSHLGESLLFMFKRHQSTYGPDIIIEHDDFESLHLYLDNEATIRSLFVSESLQLNKVFSVLEKDASSKGDQILVALAQSLIKLNMAVNSKLNAEPMNLSRPKRIKYRGYDHQGKTCFVTTVFDHESNLVRASIAYADSQVDIESTLYFYMKLKLSRNFCQTLEFDAQGSKASESKGFLTPLLLGGVFEHEKINATNQDSIRGEKIRLGGIAGVAFGGFCQRSTLKICSNSAEINQMTFGGGGVSFFPILTAGIRENISIKCLNLQVIERKY